MKPNDVVFDWLSLKNPIFQYSNWSVKDACVQKRDEFYYLFFSAFYRESWKLKSHVVEVKTKDWKNFSKPILHLDGRNEGWTGMCSPNISFLNGEYILTYNSWGDKHSNGLTNNLFCRKSSDLIHWSDQIEVALNLTRNLRTIDIAITYANNIYYLIWKDRDLRRKPNRIGFRIATSKNLSNNFQFVEDGFASFFLKDGTESQKIHENFQFISVDNIIYLLSTDYTPHKPFLYKISGNGQGKKDADWLKWIEGYEIKIEKEKFNTYHTANAAFLMDWREYDGFFYLLYAGNTEHFSHKGRGNNKLGLSRATSLNGVFLPP